MLIQLNMVDAKASVVLLLILDFANSNDHSLCQKYVDPSLPDRLPELSVPEIYDVKLQVNLKEYSFTGKQTVDIEVLKETQDLVVNGKELEVKEVSYKSDSSEVKAKQIVYCLNQGTIIFRFPEKLSPGSGQLLTLFTGILNTDTNGFYRAWYKTPDGVNHTMALSSLEPDDARRIMPCWDQPDMKAIFRITLVVPEEYQALSSGEPIEIRYFSSKHGQMKEVIFSDTPKMSTYLLTLAVGPFESIETKTSKRPRITRVILPTGRINNGKFALEIAFKSFSVLHDYFKIKYPLDKIDHVGIPEFNAGAVENYGSILYRQDFLEVDDKTPLNEVTRNVRVIIHELTHQWFGNLVTCKWWSDTWLNEAFAEYFMFKLFDKVYNGIDVDQTFAIQEIQTAMAGDAVENTSPVVGSESVSIDFFGQNIGTIYRKGSVILKMINHWIGETKFQKSLICYLRKHQYSSATTNDMLDVMERINRDKPIRKVMNSWLRQKGYPILEVERVIKGQDLEVHITQSKFSLHGKTSRSNDDENDTIWIIPIEIMTLSDPEKPVVKTLMSKRQKKVLIPNAANDIIKVNPQLNGFYRIYYQQFYLDLLAPFIQNKTLSPVDRYSIICDVLATAVAGTFPMEDAFKTLEYFKDDDSFTVWSSIIAFLEKFNIIMTNSNGKETKFWSVTIKILEKIYEKLGWEKQEDESKMDTLLRPKVISLLSAVRHQEVVRKAKHLFDVVQRGVGLDNELRQPVYETVARDGDDKSFDRLFEIYETTESLAVQSDVRSSLGTAEEVTRIRKILHFVFSGRVRTQDISNVISPLGATQFGRLAAWDYVKEHFDKLQRNLKTIFGGILSSIFHRFAEEKKIVEIKTFLKSKDYPLDGLKGTFELIKLNAKLRRILENVEM